MSYQQIKINLPHAVYSAPDPQIAGDHTNAYWMGPDDQISKSSLITALTKNTDGRDRWMITVTPDELGFWNLFLTKGDPDVSTNLGYQERFECVRATDREIMLGVQNAYQDGVVASWPANSISAAAAVVQHSQGATYANKVVLSRRQHVVPMDGYIWGVDVYTPATMDPSALTAMRFLVVKDDLRLRSCSNDCKAAATWTPGQWNRVWFAKPVVARAGDSYGWWFVSAADLPCWATYSVKANQTSCQYLSELNTNPSFSAVNAFGAMAGSDGLTIAVKLLMNPPSIAFAGHSFWAGASGAVGNNPVYADVARTAASAYRRAYDPAIMVGDHLGVAAVNCACGGTKIKDWVGAAGLFETQVVPLHPAVCLYDTVYSDTDTGYMASDSEYFSYLERLIAHADQARIELMFLETNIPEYADATKAAKMERYNGIVATISKLYGKRYIPLYYRLGEPTDANWLNRYRRQHKDLVDIADYGETGVTPVHFSQAGLWAASMAIVESFRNRRMVEPRG